jgi:hypothetical protein
VNFQGTYAPGVDVVCGEAEVGLVKEVLGEAPVHVLSVRGTARGEGHPRAEEDV